MKYIQLNDHSKSIISLGFIALTDKCKTGFNVHYPNNHIIKIHYNWNHPDLDPSIEIMCDKDYKDIIIHILNS